MDIYRKPIGTVLADLGERLKIARLNANMTQQALADAVGVSQKTVANAEDGQNISLETLLSLLRGLNRLDDIEEVLRADEPSPVALAKSRGQQRQRASGKRAADSDVSEDWEW